MDKYDIELTEDSIPYQARLDKYDIELTEDSIPYQARLDKYDVELKEDSIPYQARPYPVPHSLEQKLRKEVVRLERLKKINRSEWGSPMFTIPTRMAH
jgi:hypothetical protein